MSLNEEQNLECPLCMEPLEMDDINFFPCTCGYQICRFCWHRIRTDENGLCPACRKQYPEDPADFKPLTPEELQRIKNEKRQKDLQRKQKLSENRKHLANVRVVQKNLVFVVGLPSRLADSEVLKKHDYFGKFGKIHKVVVNQSTSYAGSQGPSASAYVTYYRAEDALRAIQAINNIHVDGRTLKASLGTTKYCSHFLKNQQCPKSDCMYLHELGDDAASFTKEEMQQGKHQEYEKKLHEQILGFNHRKHSSSPINSCHVNNKESWPSVSQKEGKSDHRANGLNRGTAQSNKEQKQSNNRNKHTSGEESQKSRKHRDKILDHTVHINTSTNKNHSRNEMCNTRKSHQLQQQSQQAQHQQKEALPQTNSQSSHQRLKIQLSNEIPSSFDANEIETEIIDKAEQNCATVVNICNQLKHQILSSPTSGIQIENRAQSSPPSPSSSSGSFLTPFGSFSSSITSSSPSPPLGSGSPQLLGSLGTVSDMQDSNISANVTSPSEEETDSWSYHPLHGLGSTLASINGFPLRSGKSVTCNGVSSSEEWLKNPDGTPLITSETIPVSSSTDWQAAFGFGQCPKSQEDELGFDPWDESSKGLADLLEKEANYKTSFSHTSCPPGFSNHLPTNTNTLPRQRIAHPPPGFTCNHARNILNIQNYPFGTETPKAKILTDVSSNHLLNGTSHLFQDTLSHNMSNRTKPLSPHTVNDLRARVNDILNIKDSLQALLPNMNFNFGSATTHSTAHSQKGPVWNNFPNDIPWRNQDAPVLNSGHLTDSRSDRSPWSKSFHQLTGDESTNGFNHQFIPYVQPFAYRAQWPSSVHSAPPGFGFVNPNRLSTSKPNQHPQVNENL